MLARIFHPSAALVNSVMTSVTTSLITLQTKLLPLILINVWLTRFTIRAFTFLYVIVLQFALTQHNIWLQEILNQSQSKKLFSYAYSYLRWIFTEHITRNIRFQVSYRFVVQKNLITTSFLFLIKNWKSIIGTFTTSDRNWKLKIIHIMSY